MGIIKNLLYKFSRSELLPLFSRQAIFPYYHIVTNERVPHIDALYRFKNVDAFRADLDFLIKSYKPLDPSQVLTGDIPDNSFLLSFDDGLAEIYSIIFPILNEYGIKAIFFINPDFVDNRQILYKHAIGLIMDVIKKGNVDESKLRQIGDILSVKYGSKPELLENLRTIPFSMRDNISEALTILGIDITDYLATRKPYITSAQIREMIDAGFYFGGHTMSHPLLNRLTFDEQKDQIIGSVAWLRRHFNLPYSLFAFPFTDKNISLKLIEALFDYDEQMVIFGNSGLKNDINPRIFQRFSLEDPSKPVVKIVVLENLYKIFNKITGRYQIRRE